MDNEYDELAEWDDEFYDRLADRWAKIVDAGAATIKVTRPVRNFFLEYALKQQMRYRISPKPCEEWTWCGVPFEVTG